MDTLVIEPKSKTPKINFDASVGHMEISGISCAENSVEFYKPVIDWIDNYKNEIKKDTTVDINYKYFNTSSAKCILDLLERFVNLKNHGTNLTINWYYEQDDEEMFDAGSNFSEILEQPFNLIEIEQ
ncbi:MAG: DUF1987 domain-containing protein [Bacteroidota bacterium]|nr:DUF1987 domain-containing protein [Bacteroidota bacterium]